jgi:hypothetical protein
MVWNRSVRAAARHGPRIVYDADRLPSGEFAGSYDGGATPTDGNGAADGGTSTPTKTPLPRMTAANGSGALTAPDDEIPLLSEAVAGLQGTFAWVPIWFGEIHLAATALGALFVLVGGVDHLLSARGVSLPGRQ